LADFLGAIRVDERGIERELQSDGLQMFKAPFISDREIASSIADTHLSEGWEYLQQQEYSQAIKSFYTALTIDSNLVSAYQGTALISIRLSSRDREL
jgi:Tfp pilus assembly protein PilF